MTIATNNNLAETGRTCLNRFWDAVAQVTAPDIHLDTAFDPLATDPSSSRCPTRVIVKHDPLIPSQKQKIEAFLSRFLIQKGKHVFSGCGGGWGWDFEGKGPAFLKKYQIPPEEMNYFQEDIAKLDQTQFRDLINAVADPSDFAAELGINPADRRQVHAARLYLKAGCKVRPSEYPEPIEALYARKLTKGNPQREISPKHEALMDHTPLQPLPQKDPSLLDYVLANTYLHTNRPSDEEKEKARILSAIKRLLRRVDETLPLFEAAGKIVKTQKGSFFLFDDISRVCETYYPNSKHTEGACGFSRNYSTFSPNPIYLNRVDLTNLSFFAHEITHFLLRAIVKNCGYPVENNPSKIREYEEACRADLEIRNKLTPPVDDYPRELYSSFRVADKRYNNLFKQGKEWIVRIPQFQVFGCKPEHFDQVCPNVYKFYREHTLPMIRQFAAT